MWLRGRYVITNGKEKVWVKIIPKVLDEQKIVKEKEKFVFYFNDIEVATFESEKTTQEKLDKIYNSLLSEGESAIIRIEGK